MASDESKAYLVKLSIATTYVPQSPPSLLIPMIFLTGNNILLQ